MNERRRLPGFDLRGRARPIRLLLGYGFAFAFSFATALVGAATARANTEPAATASCREAAPVEASSEAGAALARGNALLAVDRPLDALDAYSESERLARAEGDLRLALLAAANRARALLAADRTQELAQELDRIAELARQNEQSESATLRATVLVNLAQSYARFTGPGTPDRATRIARAAELLVEAEAAAGEASDRRLRSYALGYRAALYAEAERTDEALTLTRRALLEADAANAPDAAYRWLWQIGRLQRRSGDAGAAVDAYRQSKRILDGMRADQVVDESRFREEVQPVYRELADLLLVRARAQTEGPEKQRLLEEVRATLESFRVAELREYFGDACLDAQSRAMPESVPGTVVLHPIVLPDRVELLVSRGDGLVSVLAPISGDALETEIREFRRLVTDRTSRAYLRPSRRLYEWLIRPIAPTLADEELQALVILPEGSLRTIPFAALQDERTGRFLIEQTPLAIVPSLLLIEPRRLDAPRARAYSAVESRAPCRDSRRSTACRTRCSRSAATSKVDYCSTTSSGQTVSKPNSRGRRSRSSTSRRTANSAATPPRASCSHGTGRSRWTNCRGRSRKHASGPTNRSSCWSSPLASRLQATIARRSGSQASRFNRAPAARSRRYGPSAIGRPSRSSAASTQNSRMEPRGPLRCSARRSSCSAATSHTRSAGQRSC